MTRTFETCNFCVRLLKGEKLRHEKTDMKACIEDLKTW